MRVAASGERAFVVAERLIESINVIVAPIWSRCAQRGKQSWRETASEQR
jgi:hypothetical protein